MAPTTMLSTTKKLQMAINKNSPTIFTALGVGGLLGSVIMGIDARHKADEALAQEIKFRHDEEGDDTPLTLEEKALIVWPYYVPTVLLTLTTAGCIITANSINHRRNAALASLLAAAETGLREYQNKIVETIGEKKAEQIRTEIDQDHVNTNPPKNNTIIITGHGDYLCYDNFSKRYFRSNIEEIRRKEIAFNQRLIREGWLGVNEFYSELGLEAIELGDEFGWIAERSILEVVTSSKFATREDGGQEPCLIISFLAAPIHI